MFSRVCLGGYLHPLSGTNNNKYYLITRGQIFERYLFDQLLVYVIQKCYAILG